MLCFDSKDSLHFMHLSIALFRNVVQAGIFCSILKTISVRAACTSTTKLQPGCLLFSEQHCAAPVTKRGTNSGVPLPLAGQGRFLFLISIPLVRLSAPVNGFLIKTRIYSLAVNTSLLNKYKLMNYRLKNSCLYQMKLKAHCLNLNLLICIKVRKWVR